MATRGSFFWLACFILVFNHAAASASDKNAQKQTLPKTVQFNRDIRPIFSDKCFACHGFDAKKRKGDLRLDTLEGATAERDGQKAVYPGNLKKSLAWARITSKDSDEVMPPPKSHKKLSEFEKELIKRWIEQGAPYEKHWSFESVRKPEAPAVKSKISPRNEIDRFISAKLQENGLTLSPEADKETLIRRVAFTLTGLPPTIAEVESFLNDSTPDAYDKMVDRYFASKHHGEEMARHWLDVARYADTHGLHLDNERETWAYRDWVIKAFNENKKYDEFTIEQLAGDLLPNPTKDQLTATGFNRCNVTTSEGGSIDAELLYRYAVDRTSTMTQAWMGLTSGCAVCHDHKFDPISAREFYSMYAFFYSAADPAMDGNALLTQPVLKLSTPEQDKKLADFDAAIAARQKELDERVANIAYTDPASIEPRPPAEVRDTIWLDDDFPNGAKVQAGPGQPTAWVTKDSGAPVHSGNRSLKRSDKGLAQDYYESGAAALPVTAEAKFFLHVYMDPKDPPKSLMLQFHKGGWANRAVWGDYDAIQYGAANTFERVLAGPLPEAGKWVRLEVPASKVGLNAGDQLTGFALTMFGGTVYWDSVGISGRIDPAADPSRSFEAWWASRAGKDTPGVPGDIAGLLKEGPKKKDPKPELKKKLRDYYLQYVCAETKPKLEEFTAPIAELRKQREEFDKSIPSTFIFRDLPKPRDSFVMLRGQYDQPGEKVEPGTPAFLPPLKKAQPDARATRLDLARWLVAPEHPLTARVTVNRFWQQIFGYGLVKTSGDFGSQGEVPSHPELLDWLAADFRENGWDVRRLVRMMVTSATFRQSSRVTANLVQRDPENRLLARGPRLRLDAEQIRDNALYVSGLINLEFGGKGVKPYQPPNIWEPVGFAGSNTRFYKQDSGPALYRRSLYTFFKRTAPAPFMSNFDAPNREQSCTLRERSNTPLQALQLMNDVQHVEAARGLAQRMMTEGGANAPERLTYAFRTVLSRKPDAEEMKILQQELDAHLSRYQKDAEAAKKLIAAGESKPKAELNPSELAAYTLVASTLLNLDETLNRN
ncbi:MAG TPA: PSD1 and planctomycete cytochrome C domain-containing protein [Planctomycetota bacterium]|nr:PSD1 and planctomycete cytochrome C domain-containing protein [Planctomycetota bacterium]